MHKSPVRSPDHTSADAPADANTSLPGAAHSSAKGRQASAPASHYEALTPEICALLCGMANPAGSGLLTPAQHRQAASAIAGARAEALALARTQPRAAAQDTLLLAQALSAALATLDLLQAAD